MVKRPMAVIASSPTSLVFPQYVLHRRHESAHALSDFVQSALPHISWCTWRRAQNCWSMMSHGPKLLQTRGAME